MAADLVSRGAPVGRYSHGQRGARGLMASTLIDVKDLVGVIDGVLRAGASASVPSVAVLPRQPPLEITNCASVRRNCRKGREPQATASGWPPPSACGGG
jgi:hypothetical protein